MNNNSLFFGEEIIFSLFLSFKLCIFSLFPKNICRQPFNILEAKLFQSVQRTVGDEVQNKGYLFCLVFSALTLPFFNEVICHSENDWMNCFDVTTQ